jgi:hypothetical protein
MVTSMVVIEEKRADTYGIWMDGNEPRDFAVKSLTTCCQMDQYGIAEDLRIRWNLQRCKDRENMNKTQLWTSLLASYMEQRLMDAGVDLAVADGFLLKPHDVPEVRADTCVAKGPRPSHQRKRSTYGQIGAVCPDHFRRTVREAFHAVTEQLYFSPAEPDDYEDYRRFDGDCRRFLQEMLSVMKDENAYNEIRHMSAIRAYRILP